MASRKKERADKIKEERKNISFAKLNDCPTSPRKMRLVADLVRGKNVMDVGYYSHEILEGIKSQLKHGKYSSEHLYGDGHAGPKIAEILSNVTPPIQKVITY